MASIFGRVRDQGGSSVTASGRTAHHRRVAASTQLRVELKSRLFPSEIVRQLGCYRERGPWLVAAPVVGPRARQLLADGGISWVELGTRECLIAFGALRVERLPARRGAARVTGGGTSRADGVASDLGRRYVADLFSGKALRIVRWLLINPERDWTLDEMVSVASASPGFVSRTFATLERDAYMERERGANRVRDAEGLLGAWAAAPPPPDRVESRVSLLPTPQAVLDVIRELTAAPRYALTAEAAAEQVAPFARFSRVEMTSMRPRPGNGHSTSRRCHVAATWISSSLPTPESSMGRSRPAPCPS